MIRAAISADLPALMDLWNPLIRDTSVTFNSAQKSLADMEKMLAERSALQHGFFVAERDGAVVGFASYGQFRGGIGYARAMEHTVILGKAAHGRGLGRALMSAVAADAKAQGAHCLIAAVSSGNPEGRAFHAAIGFAEIAVVPQVGYKFGRYWDLLLMQKFLT